MRAVSQTALDNLSNTHGLEPVNLLRIYWTPTNVQWYADKNIDANIRGKILELSSFDDTVNFDGNKATQSFNVTLDDVDNTIKGIYDYNDIHKCRVQVYQWFTSIPFDDAFLIFDGEINSPIVWKEGDRTLSFAVVSQIEDQEVGFSPEEGLFDIIPSELVGKAWPLPFGTCLLIPAIKLDPIPFGILLDSLATPDPSIMQQVLELYKKAADLWWQIKAHLNRAAQALENSERVTGSYAHGDEYWLGVADQENGQALQLQFQRNKILQDASNLLQTLAAQNAGVPNSLRVHNGSCFPQNGRATATLANGTQISGSMSDNNFQIDGVVHPGGDAGNYTGITAASVVQSRQTGGPTQVIQKLGIVWEPVGQPFKLTSDIPVNYLCAMLQCTVLNVWAYRNYGDTKLLTQVPGEYYSVQYVAYGSITATQIQLPRPLGYYDKSWEDALYVDLTSPIGPATTSILTWLIENYTTKGIDAASFNLAGAYLSGCPSNFCLLKQPNVIKLLSDIAYQARCALTLKNDVFYLTFLPVEPTPVDTITEDDIIVNTLEIDHTSTENLITKMTANYVVTYENHSAFKIIIRNNTLKYGIHEDVVDWYTYTTPSLVELAASFWTIRKSNTWKLLKFKTPFHKIRLETFDPVTINLSSNWACIGPVTGIVQSVKLNTKELNLEFEVWLPVRLGEMTVYNFAWPPDSTVRVDAGQVDFQKPGYNANGNISGTNGATRCSEANRTSIKLNWRYRAGNPQTQTPEPQDVAVALSGAPDALDTSTRPSDDYVYQQYDTTDTSTPSVPDSGGYPGIVVDPPDDQGNYSVSTYLHGLDNDPTLTAVKDPTGGPQIAPGTWVTVLVSVWTEFRNNQTQTYSERYMLPSSSKSTFMGKIVGHVSDALYTVELYENGVSAAATDTVEVTQVQIDITDVIPNDTWTIVLLGTVDNGDGTTSPEYTMQVPVYLDITT